MRSLISSLTTQTARYADRLRRGGKYRPSGRDEADLGRHLAEAAAWLVRAQDAGSDRGVSYGAEFGGPFLGSYPETTGYIIPTFLALSRHYGDDSFATRAVEMGHWETQIQMECGAVMGGRVEALPAPAVFNTGMVLLGWSALQRERPDPAFLESTRGALGWLLDMQEPDGDWRRGNSPFASADSTVYNVKAAWGMCEAGIVAEVPEAVEGAIRNAEFCLSRQTDNGWFRDCCLSDASQPLLHTIAYAMQGLVGIGHATGRKDLVEAAARTADGLLALMDDQGFLPGRIASDFRGTVSWCCLTGTAQTAIVWARLFQLTADPAYREAALRATRYLMRHHDIDNPDPRLRGGVPGSWPVWGHYGRLAILNWATNFFVEALLLAKDLDGAAEA